MTHRKRWQDLAPWQQRAIVMLGVVQVALLVAALWDIWHRPEDDIKGDRRLWTAISFVNWVGPLSYFIFGRRRCC